MVPNKFIKDKFPAYYHSLSCDCPQLDALEQDVEAFRFCESDLVTPSDFLSYFEMGKKGDVNDPSFYSVSICPTLKFAIKLKKICPAFGDKFVAKGKVKGQYGPSRLNRRKNHIDWWLYQNSEPWHDFEVTDGQEDE